MQKLPTFLKKGRKLTKQAITAYDAFKDSLFIG
jgi:hypothetical protein